MCDSGVPVVFVELPGHAGTLASRCSLRTHSSAMSSTGIYCMQMKPRRARTAWRWDIHI